MPKDRQGITPGDLQDTRVIFSSRGLPVSERYFRYRPSTGRWLCYHWDGTTMTLLARCRTGHNEGWTEV